MINQFNDDKSKDVPTPKALGIAKPKAKKTHQLSTYKKNKKNLLAKLTAAKRKYDKAVKAYYLARKQYTTAMENKADSSDLSKLQQFLQKASNRKAKRRAKLEKLQALVHFYFTNRKRQLG